MQAPAHRCLALAALHLLQRQLSHRQLAGLLLGAALVLHPLWHLELHPHHLHHQVGVLASPAVRATIGHSQGCKACPPAPSCLLLTAGLLLCCRLQPSCHRRRRLHNSCRDNCPIASWHGCSWEQPQSCSHGTAWSFTLTKHFTLATSISLSTSIPRWVGCNSECIHKLPASGVNWTCWHAPELLGSASVSATQHAAGRLLSALPAGLLQGTSGERKSCASHPSSLPCPKGCSLVRPPTDPASCTTSPK